MDPVGAALCGITGVALGGLAAWIARSWRSERELAALNRQQEARAADLMAKINDLTGELRRHEAGALRVPGLEEEVARLRDRYTAETEKNARLETALEQERKAIEQQKSLLTEAQERLGDAFKALASDALNQNNKSFLELAGEKFGRESQMAQGELEKRKQAIDELVKPLREQLARYEQEIVNLEGSRKKDYGQLTEQLKSLDDRTGKLTLALRTPHARGRWGEMQLRRVAELSGMIERCDFELQASTDDGEGRQLRPDMIVKLPDGAHFVVDAKTPLDAYLDAIEKTDPDERAVCLKRHADHVQTHMDQLAAKQYWGQFTKTPDFVVMFLPGEHFLSAAIEQRPELMERGFQNKVIMATPATLIALLKTAALAWRQQQLAANAEEISRLGRELYERLATVGSHLADLGKSLEKSVRSYNQTVASLESRVLPTARKFPEMGVAPKKEIEALSMIEVAPNSPSVAELTSSQNELFPNSSE